MDGTKQITDTSEVPGIRYSGKQAYYLRRSSNVNWSGADSNENPGDSRSGSF